MLNNWICEICGKHFSTYHKTRKFCSQKCLGIRNQEKVTVPCDNCGKLVQKIPSYFKYRKLAFCNAECYRKYESDYAKANHISPWTKGVKRENNIASISGKNSHLWKGGFTDKTQRKLYKGNICGRCGGVKNLVLDHINCIHADKRKDNSQTLCRTCHRYKHNFFDSIVGHKRSFVDNDQLAKEINDEFLNRWKRDVEFKNEMQHKLVQNGSAPRPHFSQPSLNANSNGWNNHCRICSKYVDKNNVCTSCQLGRTNKNKILHYWDGHSDNESYCKLITHSPLGPNRTSDWAKVSCKQCMRIKMWRDKKW